MVLNIPGHESVLGQRDVRETAQSNVVTENFNSSDFTVASNIVNLRNKTSYYSIPGNAFLASSAVSTDDVTNVTRGTAASGEAGVLPDEDQVIFLVRVNLPHGAIVTSCVVYGDAAATAETWNLVRHGIDTLAVQQVMATANIETADTSISNATIDNQFYSYFISTTSLDTNDTIYGALIIYTTDYI